MNNFFKSNPPQSPQNMSYAYYPNPIEIDEETGKISVQNLDEPHNSSSSEQQNRAAETENSPQNTPPNAPNFNGMNMEKIMAMLKGGSSNDMLSSLLANGMKGNAQQNPMMAQALSKLLSPTKKSDSPATHSAQSNPTFEEM